MSLVIENFFKGKVTGYFYKKFAKKLSKGEDLTEEELQKAIKLGFDINATDKEGKPLCMRAAAYGKTETVRVLKKQGADIDAKDDDNWTACMEAARNDKTETLLEFVRLGADISIEDNYKTTLFDIIDDNKTKEKVTKLRKEYEENHPEAKKMAESFVSRYFYRKFASKLLYGDEDLTKEELQEAVNLGFDINATNKNGMTLCMDAAAYGKTDSVRVLVNEFDADVNARDKIGWTACMYAAEKDLTETVRVLVNEFDADVNAQNEIGWTACILAAKRGHTETVRVLVEELKANMDVQDNDGLTACMHAARYGRKETLLELVKMGADISIKDNDGRTLFDYIKDDETKEKVIKLRAEYEEDHTDATKMADALETRYLMPEKGDYMVSQILSSEVIRKMQLTVNVME